MIDIGLLKNMAGTKRFNNGDIIIQDGEVMGNEMYIILKGTVGIFKNFAEPEEIKINNLNPGDFFGEMSLFLNKERTATVVALEEVILLTINRMNAYEFFEKQPEATYALIKSLCTRLDDLNKSYQELHKEKNQPIVKDTQKKQSSPLPKQIQELYPSGHKNYSIDIESVDTELVFEKTYECPLCEFKFKSLTTRSAKLKLVSRDRDFRLHHEGIEAFYYDVVVCPECYFSALSASFNDARASKAHILTDEMKRYKEKLSAPPVGKDDINDIFAGFYLSMKCAPLCFSHCEMMLAKIWIRLSWLYNDCEDEEMKTYAVEQALKAYMEALDKTAVPAEQMRQLCLLIAELSFSLNDIDTAKRFVNSAKANRAGGQGLNQQIEELYDEIKALQAKKD